MIKSVTNINNTTPRCKAGKFQEAAVGKRIKWMSCQYRTTFNNINSADKLILKLSEIENKLGTFAAALSGIMFAAGERDLYGLLEISEKIEGLAERFDRQLPVALKNSPRRIKALYKKLLQYAPLQIDRQPDLLGAIKGFLREQNPQLKGVCHDASVIYVLFFLRLGIPVSFGYRSWAPGKEGHLFLLAQSSNSGLIKIESTEEQELEENYCLADNEIMLNHIGILPLIMAQYGSRHMLRVGDTGSMLSFCRMAREMWPDSEDLRYHEADFLVRTQKADEFDPQVLQKAKDSLKEILNKNKNHAPSWALLGLIHCFNKEYSKAHAAIGQALKIEEVWNHYHYRAQVYFLEGDLMKAYEDCERASRFGQFNEVKGLLDLIVSKALEQKQYHISGPAGKLRMKLANGI